MTESGFRQANAILALQRGSPLHFPGFSDSDFQERHLWTGIGMGESATASLVRILAEIVVHTCIVGGGEVTEIGRNYYVPDHLH